MWSIQTFAKYVPFLVCNGSTREECDLRKVRDEELGHLETLPYHERLTEFARGSTRHLVGDTTTVLDFRPLYAMNIYNLQRNLANEIQQLFKSTTCDKQLGRLSVTLSEYTNALRDFEFIHANRWETFFVKDVAASRIDDGPGSKLLGSILSELELKLKKDSNHHTFYSDADLLGSFDPLLMENGKEGTLTRGTTREKAERLRKRVTDFHMAFKRFSFAVLGGLAIVVPMLIIALGEVPSKTMLTIAISIFLFALAVACASSASPENLLGATAAYAAVLMVFMAKS